MKPEKGQLWQNPEDYIPYMIRDVAWMNGAQVVVYRKHSLSAPPIEAMPMDEFLQKFQLYVETEED
jgi:hypothetical protein